MRQDDKRMVRNIKRQIKKIGNRRKRRYLKEELNKSPETAHIEEFNYGRNSSTFLNGYDEK